MSSSRSTGVTVLVIENCEEKPTDWLLAEYSHSASLWPGTVFTGARDSEMNAALAKMGKTVKEDVLEYTGGEGCIILDHQSPLALKTEDFERARFIVVGGILGYDRPMGRTKKFITSRFGEGKNVFRNLGKIQLTIDSAVFVARAIYLGAKIEEIELTSEVEIKWDEVHSTLLPYGYPVVGGKVLITPGLIEILRNGFAQGNTGRPF